MSTAATDKLQSAEQICEQMCFLPRAPEWELRNLDESITTLK